MNNKKKSAMPDYKYMHVYLNQCLRMNMGKAMFSVLLFAGISAFLCVMAISPMAFSLTEGDGTELKAGYYAMLSFILFIACTVVINIINYGLNAMITNMVQKQYVTLGFLFLGFRDRTGRVVKSSLIFSGLCFLAALIVSVLIMVFIERVYSLVENHLSLFIAVNSVVLFVLMFIFISPFAFVNIILYTQKTIKVHDAFRLSFKMMMTHFFHAIGFMLYSGGLDLIVFIVCNIVSAFIPEAKEGEANPFASVSLILSLVGFVCEYRAIVSMYVSLPLYYFSLVGIIRDSQKKEEEKKDEAPLLIESHGENE